MIAGIFRVVLALLPLALVPVLMRLIANGRINFGGGEKDVVWALVWLLWSVLFGISSFVLWGRGWPVARSAVRSLVVGTIGVLVVLLCLALFGQLGVAGRF
jgi:hypothetical protein